MKNTHHPLFSATFFCVGTLVLWSIGPVCIKYLTGYLDSPTQNALRYTVACAFWLPMLVIALKKGTVTAQLCKRALLPSAANIVMQCLWAGMFYHINPSLAVLLTKTNVLWIAVLSMLLIPAERALLRKPRFWLGFGLSLTGVFGVLYFKPDMALSGNVMGITISLLVAFFWSVYVIAVKICMQRTDSRTSFAVISVYTVIGLWIAAFGFGDIRACLDMGLKPWGILILSAVLAIALGHVFYYAAMKRAGTTVPALVILVQPAVILGMSKFMFDEQGNMMQGVFGMVLLLGAGFAIWARKGQG